MTDEPMLIDTNILVYAFDADSGEKCTIAKDLLARCWRNEARYAVSTQNLAEFSAVVREKVPRPVPAHDVRTFLEAVMRFKGWQVLSYDAGTVILAHEIRDKLGLHFWDALLVATMEQNSIRAICTEDSRFLNVPWLSVINPFTRQYYKTIERND